VIDDIALRDVFDDDLPIFFEHQSEPEAVMWVKRVMIWSLC
jgi:hypothetical protein